MRIMVVGCGGIAYQAVSMLGSFIGEEQLLGESVCLDLVDPDVLTEGNLDRQWCNQYPDLEKVKAFSKGLPEMSTEDQNLYVVSATETHFEEFFLRMGLHEEGVIFVWPDNDQCRWDCARWFLEYGRKAGRHILGRAPVYLVTAGCSDDGAQAFMCMFRRGEVIDFREVESSPKRQVPSGPGEDGCGGGQTALSNLGAALCSFQLLWAIREGRLWEGKGDGHPQMWWATRGRLQFRTVKKEEVL